MRNSRFAGQQSGLGQRKLIGSIFYAVFLAATLFGILFLAVLLIDVARDGLGWVDVNFLTSLSSRNPEEAGIRPAIWGTIWIMVITAALTFPIGVGAAIYLQEFGSRGWVTKVIQTNIANLAGVPSIVYGLLGLAVFVEIMRMGRSVLAGAMTMTLLVLPIVIIASQEAIRAVPDSLRQGALALGATRWQMVRSHVLPAAMPGILTGTILALSRAIGETAPLIVVGAATFVNFSPSSPLDGFTVIPMQIFYWALRPQEGFSNIAAAAIVVLLAMLLTMNAGAILLRNRFRKNQNW